MKSFFKARVAPLFGNPTRAANAAKVPLVIIALVALIGVLNGCIDVVGSISATINPFEGNTYRTTSDGQTVASIKFERTTWTWTHPYGTEKGTYTNDYDTATLKDSNGSTIGTIYLSDDNSFTWNGLKYKKV